LYLGITTDFVKLFLTRSWAFLTKIDLFYGFESNSSIAAENRVALLLQTSIPVLPSNDTQFTPEPSIVKDGGTHRLIATTLHDNRKAILLLSPPQPPLKLQ